MSDQTPIDWNKCVQDLDDGQIQSLAQERGWKIEWVHQLKEMGEIGSYNGNVCFPIKVEGKEIDSIHVKIGGKWLYLGLTRSPYPFLLGVKESKRWIVGESQWDTLTFYFSQILSTYENLEESGLSLVSTRGATNASRLIEVIPADVAELILLTQNDPAGEKWERDIAKLFRGKKVSRFETPKGFKDFNEWYKSGIRPDEIALAFSSLTPIKFEDNSPPPMISFLSPSQCRDYIPPEGVRIVGDQHINRGELFVIGGEPGVGKSSLALSLAVAGAMGLESWQGLRLHCRFKTAIIQTENGKMRLKLDFAEKETAKIDDFIRISDPPPYGLPVSDPKFQEVVKAELTAFEPDVVILDPWNAVAKDDNQKEYLTALDSLINCLPDKRPAIGVIAHTRKPKGDEKRTGRGLMHLLAGSYVLSSRPRSVFILTHGSDDENGDVVIFHNPKNSNGETAPKTAWRRVGNGEYDPVYDFDWEEYEQPSNQKKSLTRDHLDQCFSKGVEWLEKNELVKLLKEYSGCGKTTVYNAIKSGGILRSYLIEEKGGLRMVE